MVIFEVPTGCLADTWGRRTSYLLGAATLLFSTLLYLAMWQAHAPLWGWAIASILLGLGFTFFSGATEAWLVDALAFSGYKETLESVMARGADRGRCRDARRLGGGWGDRAGDEPGCAVHDPVGVPRPDAGGGVLPDEGPRFHPRPEQGAAGEVRLVVRASLDNGWRNPPVRWLMLAGLGAGGVSIFAFYALQPYLLELYGDRKAFGVAGLAAAIVAGSQMVAGLIVPRVRRLFHRRTDALIAAYAIGIACLALIGVTASFWVAIVLLVIWALSFSIEMPIRQAYLNGLIPSEQRATILSFDNLMASAGGVVAQPALGRASDLWGYPAAYVISAGIQLAAVPFLVLARRAKASSDPIDD